MSDTAKRLSQIRERNPDWKVNALGSQDQRDIRWLLAEFDKMNDMELVANQAEELRRLTDALEQAQKDVDRIEWLEHLYRKSAHDSEYTRVTLRDSSMGRGFRLHSCKPDEWKPNCLLVREAIDYHKRQFAGNTSDG